jgi:glutaredoxin 2
MDDKAQVIVATNAFGMALTKQMSRPLFTSNFQKTSKIIIKKQVDLAEMEKSICGTSNESFCKQAENHSYIFSLTKNFSTMYNKLCNFFKLLMEKGSTKDSPLT